MLLGATLALLAGAAAGPAPSEPAPCAIVLGQGRNPSDGDAAADQAWDSVNRSFARQFAADLAAAGQRVVPMLLSVALIDPAVAASAALGTAAEQGCDRLIEATVFADGRSGTLVARIREYPIVLADAASGQLRIGAPNYSNQHDHDLTQTTLDRVRPGALARAMAAEYLRAQPR